jgi:hypothetical protein
VAADLALQRHPWRTKNASEAKLFFAALYTSGSIICGDRMPAVQRVLASQYYAHSTGRISAGPVTPALDHFTIHSDWATTDNVQKNKFKKLRFGTTFGFEAKVSPWNSWLDIPGNQVSPYYSRFCSERMVGDNDLELESWKVRPRSLYFVANCPDDRPAMAVRAVALGTLHAIADANVRAVLPDTRLSAGQFKAEMQQARFGLFTRGDTPSSARLYDLFSLGLIPIIVADGIEKVQRFSYIKSTTIDYRL